MSGYQAYNIPRPAEWNYGGAKWRLSRSKIEYYLECQRCFWLDNVEGLKRPPGFPFRLNEAVDILLKNEADSYREGRDISEGVLAPFFERFNIKPADIPELNTWRDPFEGVEYCDPGTGLTVCGGIDDLYETEVNGKTVYVVVDYKATARQPDVPWSKPVYVADSYKRQLEVYQWLLRKNGLTVSSKSYIIYALGDNKRSGFNGILNFKVTPIAKIGNPAWVDKILPKIKLCLDRKLKNIPAASMTCDYCKYRNTFKRLARKN